MKKIFLLAFLLGVVLNYNSAQVKVIRLKEPFHNHAEISPKNKYIVDVYDCFSKEKFDTIVYVPEYRFDNSPQGTFFKTFLDTLAANDEISWRMIEAPSNVDTTGFFVFKTEFIVSKISDVKGIIYSADGKVNGIKNLDAAQIKNLNLYKTGRKVKLNYHKGKYMSGEADAGDFYSIVEKTPSGNIIIHYIYYWELSFKEWPKYRRQAMQQSKLDWVNTFYKKYGWKEFEPYRTEESYSGKHLSNQEFIDILYRSLFSVRAYKPRQNQDY